MTLYNDGSIMKTVKGKQPKDIQTKLHYFLGGTTMIKFEVGKIYKDKSVAFEVVKRTAKTVTIVQLHHFGRWNEKRSTTEEKKKVANYLHDNIEVLSSYGHDIEANQVV